ncbi:FAD dependent oxidoreductase family protein [Asticcacaulis biprosthecium C19]|uniref:FAD dependent oxidoreductase family protein n=1 Tax=Asticcacaulis biprosthecium C19 TaxID=715226 RepID=F4QI72_9CAUL|nr:FAD-dependent oxidoreductase [Asticcacaulis biprosthecium]EGF91710.1 FAD dependent oxidoreductase family protein [Asticcacaulis biprosthecium C19]
MAHAIVTGGGIVGLNVALALQSKGFEVTLIDPEVVRSGASYGNAGHIAIEQVEPLASMAMVRSAWRRLYPKGALGLPVRAVGQWLPFSLRLLKAARPEPFARGKAALSALIAQAMPAWQRRVTDIAAPDLLKQDGHYVVWETKASATAGLKSWQSTDIGDARFHVATEDELASLKRITTADIAGAIRFENTGQIAEPARLLATMEATFAERGGTVLHERVARVSDGAVVLSGGETLIADAVVVSAGVRSKGLLEPLGARMPIVAERGYHIQSSSHGWPDGLPPVVFEDRSMIVTGFEGGLRAASFVEFAGVDDPPDAGKWSRLRQHVTALGLPFGPADQVAQWIGARPTFPDYLPAIGRLKDKVYYAFGHQHLGLTLGPVTGEIVADMVSGGEAPVAFSLERFQ